MIKLLQGLLRTMGDSVRDLAPIFIVIAVFQTLVLRQPLPDVWGLLGGGLLVVLGLTPSSTTLLRA